MVKSNKEMSPNFFLSDMITKKERDIILREISGCDEVLIRTLKPFPYSSPNISEEARNIIRKSLYINYIISYRLLVYAKEKELIKNNFRAFSERLQLLESMISINNENASTRQTEIIEKAAEGYAKIVKLKSGKIRLQNRHIKRETNKLINKHKKELSYYYQIAIELEKFISGNALNEYINDYVLNLIEELKANITYNNVVYFSNNSNDKKLQPLCWFDLFGDLHDIENWEKRPLIF